jgi:hypothetical protein
MINKFMEFLKLRRRNIILLRSQVPFREPPNRREKAIHKLVAREEELNRIIRKLEDIEYAIAKEKIEMNINLERKKEQVLRRRCKICNDNFIKEEKDI